jgi:cation diffusion facilitator CzcD-associated flavoprotein CzcO
MDNKWHIECENGTCITTRFMNCCVGFAAKRHFPDWPGLSDYQGYICHSSFWPDEGVNMKGKRVAVVGSGATGVQIAQSAAKEASELTVFIRTPNTCIPMKQSLINPENAEIDRKELAFQLEKQRF